MHQVCVCVDQIGAYCIMVGRDQAILFHLEILTQVTFVGGNAQKITLY